MSGPGFNLIDSLSSRGGEQSGGQAQGGILLQLLTRIVLALEGGGGAGGGLYITYPWAGGSLDIATVYPNITSGTFILTAAGTVILPATGGPWIIADGSGFCDPTAQITVQSTGNTVQQATNYYMISAFQAGTFIKDGASANYIAL